MYVCAFCWGHKTDFFFLKYLFLLLLTEKRRSLTVINQTLSWDLRISLFRLEA